MLCNRKESIFLKLRHILQNDSIEWQSIDINGKYVSVLLQIVPFEAMEIS